MKKNNKKLFIIIGIALLSIIVVSLIFVRSARNKTEISLSEKKWIESNKKNMIDIYVLNNLPIFTTDDSDVFLMFLNYFEQETGLTFNAVFNG